MEGFHGSMSEEQVLAWFSARLSRRPTSSDVFLVAKEMYHVGEFGKASKALQVYCGMPGKQLAGVHLLGYAQYKAGELQLALDAFRQCASDDAFGADWQLLVEIQLELDHELEHKQHLTAL